jgi:hypothetical protein
MTVNRFCASGLQSVAMAAERIRGGGAEVIVAGGTESMSMVPMGGNKVSANPWLIDHYADSYLSMGLTAERVAQHYGITREQADAFALASHQKALAAIEAGRFNDEIVPVTVTYSANGAGKVKLATKPFTTDEGPRANLAPGSGRTQTGISCPGNGHCRELIANLGWGRRYRGHVCGARRRLGDQTPGSLRLLRDRRLPAGRNGSWPGLRHS